MKYEYGKTAEVIKKLELMKFLLLSMTITYIAVEFFYNIVLPLYLIINFKINGAPEVGSDTTSWEITLQLLEDIRCEINLIFVLQMLIFFHKLSTPTESENDSHPEDEQLVSALNNPNPFKPRNSPRALSTEESGDQFSEEQKLSLLRLSANVDEINRHSIDPTKLFA